MGFFFFPFHLLNDITTRTRLCASVTTTNERPYSLSFTTVKNMSSIALLFQLLPASNDNRWGTMEGWFGGFGAGDISTGSPFSTFFLLYSAKWYLLLIHASASVRTTRIKNGHTHHHHPVTFPFKIPNCGEWHWYRNHAVPSPGVLVIREQTGLGDAHL